MQKIVITGASGFLGAKLWKMLGENYTVVGTYLNTRKDGLERLDITNEAGVHRFVAREHPEVIIHTAAISDPDACETNRELAKRINHIGTKNLVSACRENASKLIYISTNYVFDGEKGNYREEDRCNPINLYGETKLEGEQEALTLPDSVILRFDIIYGFNGLQEPNGFFSKILRGGALEVNNDQKRQPLLVDDVGHAIKVILEDNHSGIYHLAGPDTTTKYGLARALEKIVRSKSELMPIPEKQQIARRPRDITLDTTKARNIGIRFHPIAEGIGVVEHQYKNSLR